MKYTALSILLFACTVYGSYQHKGMTHITPHQLCPAAEHIYTKYCDGDASYSCHRLSTFMHKYCKNELDALVGFNPKELCPIVNLFDKLLCSGTLDYSGLKFNPKDLCPLFDYLDDKFCQQQSDSFHSGDQEFTCVLACKPIQNITLKVY